MSSETRLKKFSEKAIILLIFIVFLFLTSGCGTNSTNDNFAQGRIDPSAPEIQALTVDAIWDTVNQNYVYENYTGVDWQSALTEYRTSALTASTADAFQEIIEELLSSLPEDTVFWHSREERIQQVVDANISSTYEGIGAFVAYREDPKPHIILLAIIPGSPAEEAGLMAHDSIYAVDGLPVTTSEGIDIIDKVRGLAGTIVTLRIQSPNSTPRDVSVTRGSVNANLQEGLRASFLNGSNVLYMLLPRAGYRDLENDILLTYQSANESREVHGLILDMRITGDRAIWPLIPLLTTFTDGELGQSYTRSEQLPLTINGNDFLGSQSLPIIILVGPNTSGIPEIFVAGMQASGRAIVLGLPTASAVETFESFAMPDGSELTVAVGTFSASNGEEVGLSGVQPDVIIEDDWDSVTEENDIVVTTALQSLLPPDN